MASTSNPERSHIVFHQTTLLGGYFTVERVGQKVEPAVSEKRGGQRIQDRLLSLFRVNFSTSSNPTLVDGSSK